MNEENDYSVYRIGTGWKWFFYIGGLFLIACFGFGLFLPFLPNSHLQPSATIFLEIFLSAFILLFGGACFSTLKSRIEIDANEIRSVGLFRTKRMRLEDIEGFKILPTKNVRTLALLPRPGHGRKMKISLVYEREGDLIAWANRTLKNLDAVQYQQELTDIFQDIPGATPEEKAGKLKQAKKWCRVLNLASFPLAYWGFLWPRPYNVVVWVLIALPFVSLLFLKHFKGFVKFDARPGSAYPAVAIPFIFGASILAFRSFMDWHILEWRGFWEPFAVILLALLGLTIWLSQGLGKKVGTAIPYVIFCTAYGYGATLALNGILADSQFTRYHAKVLDRHFDTGKQTMYFLTLSPWGPRKEAADIQVPRAIYNEHPIGDITPIDVRNGKLGIPYYFVR